MIRERGPEDASVSGDPPTVRPPFSHGKEHRDGVRVPAEVGGDLPRETRLAIERRKELADVDDLGLELDHEKGAGASVPREQVDGSALPIDRERDLRPDEPAADPIQAGDASLREARVTGIDEAVEVAATPPDHVLHPDLEGAGDSMNDIAAHLAHEAALYARHRLIGHTGEAGDIGLAQAAPDPDCPNDRSQPLIIHGRQSRDRRSTRRCRTEHLFCIIDPISPRTRPQRPCTTPRRAVDKTPGASGRIRPERGNRPADRGCLGNAGPHNM